MSMTLYGIPTCGTVKKAQKWLEEQGIAYDWVDLRANPPTPVQLEAWLQKFGAKPMKNTSGGSYRALGADKSDWDDRQWLEAFTRDAMLLKRPIIEVDGAPMAVGFKAEIYEALFSDQRM